MVNMKISSDKVEIIIVIKDHNILFFSVSLVIMIFHPTLSNHPITNI